MTAVRTRPYRVGFFGLLGDGNIGNDAQFESVLAYIRAAHPDAIIDAMCPGPRFMRRAYGIDAVSMHWQQKYEASKANGWARRGTAAQGGRLPSLRSLAINVAAKGADAVKTLAWVRRHDVVIVPGAGVMEATLPLRPWEMPYAMLLLCAAGRLSGTKVALVSVGASPIREAATRWLFNTAARLAAYRSYRDVLSLEAMRDRGIDTSRDRVYPDLAFGFPVPRRDAGDEKTVAVGVLAYYGGNDDRGRAASLHSAYAAQVKRFVRWLVDGGYKVRLFLGDPHDRGIMQEILDDIRAYRPGDGGDLVTVAQIETFEDQMKAMAGAGTVVASRYHNVVCALMLGKPTISLGYSRKHTSLMAEMGLSDFCQDADSLDGELLIKQFIMARERAAELRPGVSACCAAKADKLRDQFALLSERFFPADRATAAVR